MGWMALLVLLAIAWVVLVLVAKLVKWLLIIAVVLLVVGVLAGRRTTT